MQIVMIVSISAGRKESAAGEFVESNVVGEFEVTLIAQN